MSLNSGSPFVKLGKDIVQTIALWLDVEDLARMLRTCSAIHRVLDEEQVRMSLKSEQRCGNYFSHVISSI